MRFNITMAILGIVAVILTGVTLGMVFSQENGNIVTDNYGYCIVIDAGHGGIDGGVTGVKSGVKESDLNLMISKQLYELFKSNGFNVVMTRSTVDGLYGDTSKGFKRRDMEARRKIIEEAKADLVISIHMNSYSASYRHGAQVFYQKNKANGKNFADVMQSVLNKKLNQTNLNLGGDFYICRETDAPSVIVECGFLSNPNDEALLLTKEYRTTLANAIMEGCLTYLFT